MLRFVDDVFDPDISATIGMFDFFLSSLFIYLGVDFRVRTVNIDGNFVKLAIWVCFHIVLYITFILYFYDSFIFRNFI